MPKFLNRLTFAAGASALALAAVSCSSPPSAGEPDDRPVVLTTFSVLADIAQNVAKDDLRVESITKIGAEIHGYEPTPSDVAKASDADLIVVNGLGLDSWFEQFTDHSNAPTVVASEGIEPLEITVGDYDGAPNPHAWMSPVAAETYVANLVEAFTALAPEHADVFSANAEAYIAELRRIADELDDAVSVLSADHRLLATCEGAFSYLARDVGLDEAFLWAVNQEDQGTPQQVASLVSTVIDRDVPAVFCESTVSDRAQRQVAADTGATFAGTLYVDSLSDGAPVPTYIDLLRYDVATIIAGLTEEP